MWPEVWAVSYLRFVRFARLLLDYNAIRYNGMPHEYGPYSCRIECLS
jgi:hypothetical protein